MSADFSIQSDFPRLFEQLRAYKEVFKKGWGEILSKEGREFAWALFRALKAISPAPAMILNEAIARGWAMGRKGNSLTPSKDGISVRALDRATTLLEGEKQEFFDVKQTDDSLLIRRVRFSGRTGKRLKGGRFGNRFSEGAVKGSDSIKFWDEHTESIEQQIAGNPSIRRLGHRALAAAVETSYRMRAAKGGTLAVQWLPKVFKNRKSAVMKTGPLVVRNRRGIPLGQVVFHSSGATGEVEAIELIGMVPGTGKVLDQRGILGQVESARVADRAKGIADKLTKAKAKAALR